MTTMSLMPYFTQQFFDDNGAPLAGGKLYFYEPGTTTDKTVYGDSTGLTALSNPVTLDSAGRTTVYLNGYYKIVMKDANDTTIDTQDNVSAQYFQTSTFTQWINQSNSFTYISANQFSLTGDATANFEIGRRVQANVTAGTIYGTVSNSSANGSPSVTTVTTIWDSGNLDSGLSAVSLGVVTESNNSLPILTAQEKSANYTLTLSDYNRVITLGANAVGLTLLAANAVPDGFRFEFINIGANQATVTGTINGFANVTFLQYEGASIFSDGANWFSFNMHNQNIVGDVRLWHKTLSGVPQTLPWGWVECDGSVVSDSESPLNGQTIPDINGSRQFIRCADTSGNTQSNVYANHSHSLTISQTSAYMRTQSNAGNDYMHWGAANANGTPGLLYGESTVSGNLYVFANQSSWNFTGSSIGSNGTGNETYPDNITMVAIMKIK